MRLTEKEILVLWTKLQYSRYSEITKEEYNYILTCLQTLWEVKKQINSLDLEIKIID